MSESFDIWKMLAGVAIFMLGMNFMEEGVNSLTGRSFKLFLKKHTSGRLKGILGGAAVTAVLQSSSIVKLMVLAFTGAGIITIRNAMTIVLGSNIGTTLNSWLIATVGFEFNLNSFSLPITAVMGIVMILTRKENKIKYWSRLLFGFGFMFMGLDFIKTGIEEVVQKIDLASLNDQPRIVFLLGGFIITTLIQSSSATVAIVLSALHAEAIPLLSGMIIIIGAEVGTTVKLILASLNGEAVKKRVALGDILYNIITTILVFVLIDPIHYFVTETLAIKDSLYALVSYQTLTNIAGVMLFFPFLDQFGRFLEKQFINDENETLFIHKVNVEDADLALPALRNEVRHLIFSVANLAQKAYGNPVTETGTLKVSRLRNENTFIESYNNVKHLHGEIHHFAIHLQQFVTDDTQLNQNIQMIDASRNAMYAAKSIKDTMPDIQQLKKSSNDTKFNYYQSTRENTDLFCKQITALLESESAPDQHFTTLQELQQYAHKEYRTTMENLYRSSTQATLSEIEFSTIINFNRETYTLRKSLIISLNDFLLPQDLAVYFDEITKNISGPPTR